MKNLYIGLMSGTSMDGIDAVLVDFSKAQPKILAHHTEAFPEYMLKGLHQLCQTGKDEINRLGQLDRSEGKLFAQAVNQLLNKANISSQAIQAIGSHGQTIRHMPSIDHSFTLQIGDPNTIAVETGIDVIADFRRKDMALGGQGAPLVPAFHQQIFACQQCTRMIVNIGGIANLTYLPGKQTEVLGFDTGPGNTLIDYWCKQYLNKPFDTDGNWAKSGITNSALLKQLLAHSYFSMPFPKSTGREMFNSIWLEQHLENFGYIAPEDVQSTLLDLTCQTIAMDITKLSIKGELYICGGGAMNSEMMRRLALLLPDYSINTTSVLGVDPKWVEATAFAWLAKQYELALPGNLPAVTGASRMAVLGAKYLAK